MYPILYELIIEGEKILTLGSYRFFGMVAAGYMLLWAGMYLKRCNLAPLKIVAVIIAVITAFFAGSRLLYVLLYLPGIMEEPHLVFDLSLRNFALHGGLFFSLFTWWLVARLWKLPFLKLTDKLVPHVGLAIGIMRAGCFLNGCCYGRVTRVPWGINVPLLSSAHLAQIYGDFQTILAPPRPVHPTQLYEMGAALTASLAAWLVLRRRKQEGLAVAVFGLVLSAGRFITFFFRSFPVAEGISNMI
ncbi:MAG: hypothetical protein D5R97_00690, partial [Candidatus Syntrophonatronum acetioxidans]